MSAFSSTMETLLKNVDSVLSTKTVVGDAKQVGDTVIIPLVDVSFGIGAGGNSNDKKNGAGGGISGKMSPSAVLVIKDGHTKVVNIKNQDAVTKVLDLVPDIMNRFTAKNEGIMDDDKAVDIAFPEEKEDK